MANPLLTLITATVAGIAAIVKITDTINISAEESSKKLSELQDEFDTNTSELESLNSELETTQSRMDELQAKGHLSLTEQKELDRLKEQNTELERSIALKEADQKIEAKKLAKQASETYEKYTNEQNVLNHNIADRTYSQEKIGDYKNAFEEDRYNGKISLDSINLKDDIFANRSNSKDINYLIAAYEVLNKEQKSVGDNIDKITKKGSLASDEEIKQAKSLQTYYDSIGDKILEVESLMSDYSSAIKESYNGWKDAEASGVITDKQKQQLAEAEVFISEYNKLIDPASATESAINGIFAKAKFEGVKDSLVSIGKEGSSAVLDLISTVPGLTDELNNAGVSAQQLCDFIMNIANPDSLNLENIKLQLRKAFLDGKDSRKIKDYYDFLTGKSDEEIEIFYKYVKVIFFDIFIEYFKENDLDISDWTKEDLEYNFRLSVNDSDLGTLSERFESLWNSESFEDAQKDLIDLAKEAGVTADDIKSLASENDELAILLTESGMSAQFAAACFDKMANGVDGFSSITSDALLLDQVLHGLDGSLEAAANAKSKYDQVMEQNDYNSEFKNYQEAYAGAMEMFENGEYGRQFRSTMEYLLGDQSYTMSIEEMYDAVKNLKSIFGEDANNGLEFLDKLYANKDIFDDLESSLTFENGSYDFDFKPEEFEKIAEAVGMTTEEVAACSHALGMFGDYRSYDLDELELAFNSISTAASDGEKSIVSLQGIKSLLSDLGYNGYEITQILDDVENKMDSIQTLDFSASDTDSLNTIIDKLQELNMINIDGNNLNIESLIQTLGTSFGMASEDIDVFISNLYSGLEGKFNFTDLEGQALDLAQAKELVLASSEDAGAIDDMNELGTSADTTKEKIDAVGTSADTLNNKSFSLLVSQFSNVGTASDNAKTKVQSLIDKINEVNRMNINPSSGGSDSGSGGSENNSSGGTSDALGNAQIGRSYATGSIGAKKTETALINELGSETIISPETGTYEIVEGGAQFRKIKKGQIILNHLQTLALQKYGKIKSFGKMLFGGNAKVKGKAYNSGSVSKINPVIKKPYQGGSGSGSDGGKTTKKNTEAVKRSTQVFDWVAVRLEYFANKTKKIADTITDYVTLVFKKAQLKKQMTAINKEIRQNELGASAYLKKANSVAKKYTYYDDNGTAHSVSVPAKYKKLVRKGNFSIEDMDTSTEKKAALAEAIQSYQDYYTKAQNCKQAVIDLRNEQLELYEDWVNIPTESAEKKIDKLDTSLKQLERDYSKLGGYNVSAMNANLDQQTDNARRQSSVYQAALTQANNNATSANKKFAKKQSAFNAKDKKKLSKSQQKALENGTEINTAGITNKALLKKVNAYNQALQKSTIAADAYAEALDNATEAEKNYIETVQTNAKAKFDNDVNEYDLNQSGIDADSSILEAQKKNRTATGKSRVSDAQKDLLIDQIANSTITQYNKQNQLEALKKSFAENANNMTLEDRYDAENQIKQLEADILDVQSEIADLWDEYYNIEVEKLADGMERLTVEADKLQGAMDLDEALGKSATSGQYEALIQNSKAQVSNLESQNRLLAEQQAQYEIGSEKYNELQSQIDSNNSSIRDAAKSQVEWNNAIAELPYTKLEKALELLDAIAANNESLIELKSAKGEDLSESDYMLQIADNNDQIEKYSEERAQALSDYQKALADSDGVYGGKTADEWREKYLELGTEINNLLADNEELKDSLRDDVYWRPFERAHDAAESLQNILKGISDLISDDMYFDKNGKLTEYGITKIASLTKEFENAREEVQNYTNDIQNLNKLYSDGWYTENEYLEKLNELQTSMLDSASSMKTYTDSIVKMYKDIAQSELDALFELIDARNEALSAKKEYYDYDKTISSKTKDIQALKAQIAALEGIDTAEAKAKKATLESDLSDAQEDLDDIINEHLIELSQESLDEMKQVLQDQFDDKFDTIGSNLEELAKLMSAANSLTESSANTINNALNELLKYYGINPVATKIDTVASYASGTKSATKKGLSKTQEDGREIIITKNSVLVPINIGDGVIPNVLTENLFKWGEFTPNTYVDKMLQNASNITSKQPTIVNNHNHYDSLCTIQGDVTKEVFPGVKAMCQKAFDYTAKELGNDVKWNKVNI